MISRLQSLPAAQSGSVVAVLLSNARGLTAHHDEVVVAMHAADDARAVAVGLITRANAMEAGERRLAIPRSTLDTMRWEPSRGALSGRSGSRRGWLAFRRRLSVEVMTMNCQNA